MRSIDFVLAYPQAEVKTDIYMRIPSGTMVENEDISETHALKLVKNLYGLKDAGLTWHEHIKKGLFELGFKQSEVDP
jgi:Reverse transcriptase (RNA-dependent DNA polymerase)